jgi:hypothetical protein
VSSVPPAQFVPYQAQAVARRSVATRLLIGLCTVLAVGLVASVAVGGFAVARTSHELATRQNAKNAQASQDQTAAAKQQDDLKSADLAGKLQQVKDLDKAADAAYAQWQSGSVKFGVLSKAITTCDNAVDAYDKAAAPFPASLLPSGMPAEINTANPETDCGRAFTNQL